ASDWSSDVCSSDLAAIKDDRLRLVMVGGDLLDPPAEAAQPLDHGLVFGDLGVARDNEGQRFLDTAEGRGDLHQPAELDLLGEIARRRNQERKYRRHLLITVSEPAQFLAAADNAPPIRDDMRKALVEVYAYGLLDDIVGYAFGII